jgi:hypothetical protein
MNKPNLYTRDAFTTQTPVRADSTSKPETGSNYSAHAGLSLFIDAGIGHIRFLTFDRSGDVVADTTFPSNTDLPDLLSRQ